MYDYGPSQNCFKVRLLAAQLNIVLDIVPVAIFKGEGALPGFLEKNPMGGVPVLETDSGEYLPESNAILTFLADGTRYLPRDGMARAQVIRWLMFEQRYIQTSIPPQILDADRQTRPIRARRGNGPSARKSRAQCSGW